MPRGGTDDMIFCSARRNYDGQPCRQPAIKGCTVCRMHGGSAKQVREAAKRRVLEEASIVSAHKYGKPRQVTAIDALSEELHRTQGHVDWLSERVADNPDPGWLSMYQQERAHLARLSHQMITANVAERQMVIAEQATERLESALSGALRELGHNVTDPRVRAVLARHLKAVADQADGIVTAEIVQDGDDEPSNVRPLPTRF